MWVPALYACALVGHNAERKTSLLWFWGADSYTVEPHLSGLFTYPDTCLGTNPYSSTESDPFIRKFSYPDSQSGNEGVRISEV